MISRIFRIKKNGEPYKGCYCSEYQKIENYKDAISDTKNIWICHHKLEAYFTREELIQMNRYYNVSARELVFVRDETEHHKYPHKGMEYTVLAAKGREPWNKNKQGIYKHTEETKKKISASGKGKHNHTGENNPNFGKKHKQSAEACTKKSEANKGRHWWSNGKISKFCVECPGSDFHLGRR